MFPNLPCFAQLDTFLGFYWHVQMTAKESYDVSGEYGTQGHDTRVCPAPPPLWSGLELGAVSRRGAQGARLSGSFSGIHGHNCTTETPELYLLSQGTQPSSLRGALQPRDTNHPQQHHNPHPSPVQREGPASGGGSEQAAPHSPRQQCLVSVL